MSAHGALDRAVSAYLAGDGQGADLDFDIARAEVARTGRIDLAARVELVRCAAQFASLLFEPCTGFERTRDDASDAERAYADFLLGRIDPARIELLPVQHRAVASAGTGGSGDLSVLQAIADPLGRLVAAAYWLRAGRATREVADLAVAAASGQGWRRPLLAWLKLQQERAGRAGDSAEVERLGRRIRLVLEAPGRPQPL